MLLNNAARCLRTQCISKWTQQSATRSYSRSSSLFKASEVTSTNATTSQAPPPTPPKNPSVIGGPRMAPTALDKIFLTWSGQFKSKSEIPPALEGDTIFKARSYARIRINIGFLFLAAFLSGLMIYSGKQAAKRGESIEKSNLDWHKQVKEEYERELALNNNRK